jgi:hypothetical protein
MIEGFYIATQAYVIWFCVFSNADRDDMTTIMCRLDFHSGAILTILIKKTIGKKQYDL